MPLRTPKQAHIGPMSKNSANVPHYIPPRIALDIPTRVTNAGSKQPLDLASLWATPPRRALWATPPRRGSMVAFSLPSRGVRT